MFYVLLKDSVFRSFEVGVGIEQVVYLVACGTYQGFVVDDVGYFQIEHTALLKALKVSRTSQSQVGFGNGKTVGGTAHGLDALLAVVAQFFFGHENAIGLAAATTYTASELVQLAKSETLGILYHHDSGIGHVNTHLNHCGRV